MSATFTTVFLQIYPRDTPEVAAKRLVLENVLLLAHRRTPLNDHFDLENVEVRVPLCYKCVSLSLHPCVVYIQDLLLRYLKYATHIIYLFISIPLSRRICAGHEADHGDLRFGAAPHLRLLYHPGQPAPLQRRLLRENEAKGPHQTIGSGGDRQRGGGYDQFPGQAAELEVSERVDEQPEGHDFVQGVPTGI